MYCIASRGYGHIQEFVAFDTNPPRLAFLRYDPEPKEDLDGFFCYEMNQVPLQNMFCT
jgi:hypothetical protein